MAIYFQFTHISILEQNLEKNYETLFNFYSKAVLHIIYCHILFLKRLVLKSS
jgi:hypothetical protein